MSDTEKLARGGAAKDVPENAADMRAIIERRRYDNPLIHRVLDQARYLGWSGEDTYTVMAWHALEEARVLKEMVIENLRRTPRPGSRIAKCDSQID